MKKVIPDNDTLEEAYKIAIFCQKLTEKAEEIHEELSEEDIKIPDNLKSNIEDEFKRNQETNWDKVYRRFYGFDF